MHRITITVDDDLLTELDRMIDQHAYPNRSEALRDLARAGMKELAVDAGHLQRCVGVLSYVYDHEARDLASRLTKSHHHHHDISVASLHVHLNSDRCLEVSILKGATEEVRHFADNITAQRAVAYGELKIIPDDAVSNHAHCHEEAD